MTPPTFSVIRRPGRGRLPASQHIPFEEPVGPDLAGWEAVASGLSEEDAMRTAAELNLAQDVVES